MKSWILKNYEMILTVLISIMICTTRSSMAFGNLIYGLIVLITLLTWYKEMKFLYQIQYANMDGHLIRVCCYVYYRLHLVMIYEWRLSTSLIFGLEGFNYVPILLFIKSSRKLYTILSIFLYIGTDALSAFAIFTGV